MRVPFRSVQNPVEKPPQSHQLKNPPCPKERKLAAVFPMKRKEEKDKVKRQRGKKKRIKKIVGRRKGRGEARGKEKGIKSKARGFSL